MSVFKRGQDGELRGLTFLAGERGMGKTTEAIRLVQQCGGPVIFFDTVGTHVHLLPTRRSAAGRASWGAIALPDVGIVDAGTKVPEKEEFMRECTEAVFLKDVANHQMTVLQDSGLYRHLRFASKDPHSWNQWFDIVTWPGRLAYSGDLGTFVFSRLEDMFEFFRVRPADEKAQLHINTGYWAEKLLAVDRDHRNNSEMAFSEDALRERVEDHVKDWIEDEQLTDDQQAELRDEIQEQVLSVADDGEYAAHQALREFSCEIDGRKFEFSDTWEWDLREYTFRFVWCCYAVAWAIKQYDEAKARAIQDQVA